MKRGLAGAFWQCWSDAPTFELEEQLVKLVSLVPSPVAKQPPLTSLLKGSLSTISSFILEEVHGFVIHKKRQLTWMEMSTKIP